MGVEDVRPSRLRGWLERAWRWRLFLLIAFTYAYFYQGGDPNQATRFYLTRSLVERRAPDITPYHAYTIDKSEYAGKFWCDKAPAISMMATVPYALENAGDRLTKLDSTSRPVERVRLHMIVIVISVLSGVLACFFLHRTLRRFGASPRIADLLTVGYGLGTLAFPFSTLLFGHETAAALLAASFYYVVDTTETSRREKTRPSIRRLALLGALWGSVLTLEYPTGILVACQGLYLLFHNPRPFAIARVFGGTFIGALLPLALHSAFLWWAFDNPFSLAYTHMAQPIFLAHVSTGILGINVPTGVGAFGTFLSRYRGLFFFCPFLVLTFMGLGSWLVSGERRGELALAFVSVVAYSIFCTGYYAWDGGGSTGPRHLVPVLPLFVLPIGFFARSRAAAVVVVTAMVPSILIMLACTATRIQLPEGDPWRANPLYEIVLPALARGETGLNRADVYSLDPRGDASYNLGTLFGLTSLYSLVPLVAVWIAAYAPVRWARARLRLRPARA